MFLSTNLRVVSLCCLLLVNSSILFANDDTPKTTKNQSDFEKASTMTNIQEKVDQIVESNDVQKMKIIHSGRNIKFNPGVHIDTLPNTICKKAMLRAQYFQDFSFHAFDSETHFDNCVIKGSVEYLNQLFIKAQKDARYGNYEEAAFTLGQIIHIIQDFYSHSNYIELMNVKYSSLKDVPVPIFWGKDGQKEAIKLVKNGLISGAVSWSLPHECKDGTPTHTELAKDDNTYKSGKKKTRWGITFHEAALEKANEATQEFFIYALSKMPKLAVYCEGDIYYLNKFIQREQDRP